MSVGTWGPGTGATGTGSHPFCLRIQGVDYIGSVDLSSIVVNASVSSNATLTFTAWDATSALPIPQGWADVEFLDTTEEEWIFGGLVMGVEVSPWAAAGRRIDVRCVDYGVLLDVTPVTYAFTQPGGSIRYFPLATAAACPLGGVMAMEWASGGAGRVVASKDGEDYIYDAGLAPYSVTIPTVARSALDGPASRVEYFDSIFYTAPAAVFVTPLKQLAVLPSGVTYSAAPLEVRQNPTTASHVAADAISVDADWRGVETGVYLSDSYTTDSDDSAYHLTSTNGYTLAPSSASFAIVAGEPWAADYAEEYRQSHDGNTSGEATVTTVKNFQPGQALTVYYPSIDLDGTYAITAVTTRFLGGGLKRQSTIQFNGERGTVARFNRTRFARAGVTT